MGKLKIINNKVLLGLILMVISLTSNAQETSSLVYMDGGKLVYPLFANEGQTNKDNRLPDWSHAGYMGGGVVLPAPGDIPVIVTLSPDADDDDDGPRIQEAIDQVQALPLNGKYRGAILLEKGYYEVENTLKITKSGIVLRGEGQGISETVVEGTRPEKYSLIDFGVGGNGVNLDPSIESNIITPYAGIGANKFRVNSTSGFSQGDLIGVIYTRNTQWLSDLGVDNMGTASWETKTYTVPHIRKIVKIDGDTIFIDIPLVDVIQDAHGGGKIEKASYSTAYVQNSGIEDIRLSAKYNGNDNDENHCWHAIICRRIMNSWIRNVTMQHFGMHGVKLRWDSDFNTIQDCAVIDHKSLITGTRRYSFSLDGGTCNLVQRCYVRDTRHAFTNNAVKSRGPNVFLDCYSEKNHSDVGPHQRWSTGVLFDNIYATMFQVSGFYSGGHGWKAAQCMLWNIVSDRNLYAGGAPSVKVSSPPGYRNWGIGVVPVAKPNGSGIKQEGDGFWEHWESHVAPRSLYLQQLEDRLGSQAVENITIPEQRNGTIWDMLKEWKGEGRLLTNTEQRIIQDKSCLKEIYPNPARDKTVIKYMLTKQSNVRISIFNMQGVEIRTLINKKQRAGQYNVFWNSRDDVHKISGGVYLVRFTARSGSDVLTNTQKLLLIE